MKVLQINAVYNYSSTGRITTELHNALINKGIESFAVCSKVYNSNDEVYRIGSDYEVKFHGMMSRLSGKQGYFSKKSTEKLLKYINSIKPDIVHLGNLHSNYVNLPMLLAYLAENDIATVITLHDCWFFTGKCMYYTVDNCYKWQTGCHDCSQLHTDNKSYFLDRTTEMWRDKKRLFESIPRLGVIGVSDWIANEAKKSLLSNAKIIRRIYNWIDLEIFKPVNSASLRNKLKIENKFIILCVASKWSERKGVSTIMALAKIIDNDTVILMVGDANNHNLSSNNIIQINSTNSVTELVDYYSMADVFFQPSLEETFGKVTAEALSCGTPVICFNSTANSELVGEGCGYILDKVDIDDVINAINIIKETGKDKYSLKCRTFADMNFSKDDRINDHIQLYNELINMKV